MVLIDSGSTHNFIQVRVAKKFGLPPPAQGFRVLVGNGEELNCTSLCQQIGPHLDSHVFSVDLFVLPLSGVEIVLGVQWLKILNPILTNYDYVILPRR